MTSTNSSRAARPASKGSRTRASDVFGWWQLPVDKPTACTVDDMFDLKDSLLAYDGTQGVNLASYEHVVVWFADDKRLDWAGELPGSWSWINGYDDTSVIAHEIGHNMGAHHAASLSCGSSTIKVSRSGCSYSEYGDPLDVMGSSSALMSSWHRAQVQQLPVAALQTVTTAGSYVLDEANGAVADDPRLLLVPRQVGSAPVTEYFAIGAALAVRGFRRVRALVGGRDRRDDQARPRAVGHRRLRTARRAPGIRRLLERCRSVRRSTEPGVRA